MTTPSHVPSDGSGGSSGAEVAATTASPSPTVGSVAPAGAPAFVFQKMRALPGSSALRRRHYRRTMSPGNQSRTPGPQCRSRLPLDSWPRALGSRLRAETARGPPQERLSRERGVARLLLPSSSWIRSRSPWHPSCPSDRLPPRPLSTPPFRRRVGGALIKPRRYRHQGRRPLENLHFCRISLQ